MQLVAVSSVEVIVAALLQLVAACCSLLQLVEVSSVEVIIAALLQLCCSLLQLVAVPSVEVIVAALLQLVAALLQLVAACCSLLQVWRRGLRMYIHTYKLYAERGVP